MGKYLLVNADDFGMCKSANEAVFDLFKNGRLKSATIMMPCPAAIEAVEFSKAHPEYAIGVHLTLTSEWNTYRWKPLTDGKTLLDEEGFMWHSSKDVAKNGDIKEIEAEMRAQIDYAHSLGMKPSHLDNHMGSLYGHQTGRFSLLKMTLRVCGEYKYAYRLFDKHDKRICPRGIPYFAYKLGAGMSAKWGKKYNVIMPDYLLFPDWGVMPKGSYEEYRKEILRIWCDIPEGVTETFVHPAKESDELKSITGNWWQRVWEYQLMNDPETEKILNEHGVELVSYRELIKMKTK
ncbi:MAG: polysaccharide deacetylase family protein [Clostridia bacterium]|nr:polysaccharide deacetylase family protein [Clostridia bacterium]